MDYLTPECRAPFRAVDEELVIKLKSEWTTVK